MRACLSKFILACTDAGDDSTIDEQIGACYILLSIRKSLSSTSQCRLFQRQTTTEVLGTLPCTQVRILVRECLCLAQ